MHCTVYESVQDMRPKPAVCAAASRLATQREIHAPARISADGRPRDPHPRRRDAVVRRLLRDRALPAGGRRRARRPAGGLVHHGLGPQPERHAGRRHLLPPRAPGQPLPADRHRLDPARRHEALRQRGRDPVRLRGIRRPAHHLQRQGRGLLPHLLPARLGGRRLDRPVLRRHPGVVLDRRRRVDRDRRRLADPAGRQLGLPLQLRLHRDHRQRDLPGRGHGQGRDGHRAGHQELQPPPVGAAAAELRRPVPRDLQRQHPADRDGDLRQRPGDRLRLVGVERGAGPVDAGDGVRGRAAGRERPGRDDHRGDGGRRADRRRHDRAR